MILFRKDLRTSLLVASVVITAFSAVHASAGQPMEMRPTDGSGTNDSSRRSESKPLVLPTPLPPLPEKQRCVQVTYQCGDTTCTGVRCQ
ncbi:hypothetical protein [Rhizobium leguminosarum]|uniref:Uncharacterized protein n=1 Tax=Rhizobium leguminosarum TaxID=384 RepID=A0A1B1CHP7_RHILE|nr:hypothetical protein [Rhizobium leguminosarum]ANP89278.1 hypothetical protein BA011_26200 [Rhizobium leguminosarum]